MKTASVKEIKDEIERMSQPELVKLCLRLIKFKKETKELSSYLLFNAHDEDGYIEGVKELLRELFKEVNTKNLYIAKKNVRKILRLANRYIKYSSEETTEIELLMYVCESIKELKLDMKRSVQLQNLYTTQIKKIKNRIESLHEDLQYDYEKRVTAL